VEDLRALQSAMTSYVYAGKPYDPTITKPAKAVAPDLAALAADTLYQKLSVTDPETGTPYEYRVLNPVSYELCAQFSLPRDLQYDSYWNHPAGRHCYSIDVTDTRIR
jgi:hypothetical protein